jgi:hypothetical protein
MVSGKYICIMVELCYLFIGACLCQDRFGPSQHTSKKLLHYILRKLTSLVPFEPAYCLKVGTSYLALLVDFIIALLLIPGSHAWSP